MSSVPAPLAVMRSLLGTTEAPGGADNPAIIGWREEIARRFPEMAEYARLYRSDATPWCGYAMGYVMARCGARPPFGAAQTERFMWAEAWKDWGDPVEIADARPGDVVVLRRHVTMLDRRQGDVLICIGGNQADQVKESRYPVGDVLAVRRAPAAGAAVVRNSLTAAVDDDLAGVGRSTDPSTATTRQDIPKELGPASIRYNNPGAQYPSAEAARFGQVGYGVIGGGHKIARFPHPVNGAACNLDLLRRRYVGMTIGAAGTKWTGANGFGVPGYDPDAELTADMVDDPGQAIPLMRAIARREAGRESPLTPAQWRAAHEMFRAGSADAWLAGRSPAPTAGETPPITGEIIPPSEIDRIMAEIDRAIRPILEKRMTENTDRLDRIEKALERLTAAPSALPPPAPAPATPAPKIDLGGLLGKVPWGSLSVLAGGGAVAAGAQGAIDWDTVLSVGAIAASVLGVRFAAPLAAVGKGLQLALPILKLIVANADSLQAAIDKRATTDTTQPADQAKGSIG